MKMDSTTVFWNIIGLLGLQLGRGLAVDVLAKRAVEQRLLLGVLARLSAANSARLMSTSWPIATSVGTRLAARRETGLKLNRV